MQENIPFNRPDVSESDLANVQTSIARGHLSSGGPFTRELERTLKAIHHAPDALLTASCTDALEMCALLLDIKPGDLVIMPSFTFTSTALAFARQGAKIRFVDIRETTLGLNSDEVERAITPDVKAIVTVNYAGVASDLFQLRELAHRHQIVLIEDNAHGLFATHRGSPLGSIGDLSTLSFHETKNLTCGEGGALIINNDSFVDRAHILLDKGTNRQQFLNGQVDKYTWLDVGSSFGLSEILASILYGQFERSEQIRKRRREIHQRYFESIEPLAYKHQIKLPYHHDGDTPADHMFYLVLGENYDRNAVIETMRTDGIYPTFHYVPLHNSPAGHHFTDSLSSCPVTEDIAPRLLRLPFFNAISRSEQDRVVNSLERALRGVH